MRSLYILLIFCGLAFTKAHSQPWIRKGGTWHYEWVELQATGFHKIHYERDTFIGGKTCQKLSILEYDFGVDQNQKLYLKRSFYLPPRFSRVSGDTVFYLQGNLFRVLYNFKAMPNDTWQLGTDANGFKCTGSAVKVDSIGVMKINSKDLRWMVTSPLTNSNVRFHGKINERFGAMEGYLFPEQNTCDTNIAYDGRGYYFTCYEDDSFPLYNVSGKDCEYLLMAGVDKDFKNNWDIQLYPNPANNLINVINAALDILRLEFYDVNGRIIMVNIGNGKGLTSDISSLSQGVYFLKVITANGTWGYKRLVVYR
jgi:hypothetical protein